MTIPATEGPAGGNDLEPKGNCMTSNDNPDSATGGTGPSADVTARPMDGLRGHILTWAASVVSACIVGAAWVYTNPPVSFVAVDVNALVKTETELLAKIVKQDATKEQQEAAIRRASEFGRRLDDAIARLAAECGCVVINTAAIVAQSGRKPVPDATERVRRMLAGDRPDDGLAQSGSALLDRAWKEGEKAAGGLAGWGK